METTIPGILRARALSTPTETALLLRGESGAWRPLSCEELWRSVLAVAAGLEDLGLAKGDREDGAPELLARERPPGAGFSSEQERRLRGRRESARPQDPRDRRLHG